MDVLNISRDRAFSLFTSSDNLLMLEESTSVVISYVIIDGSRGKRC